MRQNQIPKIDLHGKIEDEVFDLLDQFISKHRDQEQILVIVGKGRGIVCRKVLEYLKMGHYPWSYEKVNGVDNKGALVIDLY